MDHMVWVDDGSGYSWSEPVQVAEPEPLHDCSDGRQRTAAERDAWLAAIWGAVRDGATC